jgi:hypothetical protein
MEVEERELDGNKVWQKKRDTELLGNSKAEALKSLSESKAEKKAEPPKKTKAEIDSLNTKQLGERGAKITTALSYADKGSAEESRLTTELDYISDRYDKLEEAEKQPKPEKATKKEPIAKEPKERYRQLFGKYPPAKQSEEKTKEKIKQEETYVEVDEHIDVKVPDDMTGWQMSDGLAVDITVEADGKKVKTKSSIGAHVLALRKNGSITPAHAELLLNKLTKLGNEWRSVNDKTQNINNDKDASTDKQNSKPKSDSSAEHSNDRFMEWVVKKLMKAFPNIEIKYNTDYESFVVAANEAGYPAVEIDGLKGFFDQKTGVIYLNPKKQNNKTAIHEYAHVWALVAKQTNKGIYNKGKSLVKGTKYEQQVRSENDYRDLTEDEILEEALVRAIADKGAAFVQGNSAVRFREWSYSFWNKIKSALGINRRIDLSNMSLNDFSKTVARELLGEVPISNISDEQLKKIENKEFSGITVDKGVLARDKWYDRTKTKTKRYFSITQGVGVFKSKFARAQGKVDAYRKRASYNVKLFNNAVAEHLKQSGKDKAGKKKLAKEIYDNANLVLSGKITPSALPDSIAAAVEGMRNDINQLQIDLVEFFRANNMMTPEFEGKLTESIGIWVHRSYRMHDVSNYDKKWEDFVSEEDAAKIKSKIASMLSNGSIASISWETDINGDKIFRVTNVSGVKSGNEQSFTEGTKDLNDWLMRSLPTEEATAIHDFINGKVVEGDRMKKWTDRRSNLDPVNGSISFDSPTENTEENQQLIGAPTQQVIENHISAIVKDSTSTNEMMGISGTSVGSGGFGASVTKKRKDDKDLDEVIRKLMGEYLDPTVNYTKSVAKVAELLEKGKVEQEMLDAGSGYYFAKAPTSSSDPKDIPISEGASSDWIKVSPSESYVLSRENVWMHPDLHDSWFKKPKKNPIIIRELALLNGWVKSALTIQKDDSQSRNFWGAWMNLWSTGLSHFAVTLVPMISPTLMKASITGSQDFKRRHWIVGGLMAPPLGAARIAGEVYQRLRGFKTEEGEVMSKDDFVNEYLDAVKYRLVEGSVDASVIREIMERNYDDVINAGDYNISNVRRKVMKKTGAELKKLGRVYMDTFSKPYQLSDTRFKLVQWEMEKKVLKKAYSYKVSDGEMTKEEFDEWVKEKAADTVRAEQPTYSNESRAMKGLSRNVALGAFVMWTSQMYRTRVSIIKSISERIAEAEKTDNAKAKRVLRLSALDKAAGLTTQFMAGRVVAQAIAASLDWDDKMDDALAKWLPFYEKNAGRMYLSDAKKALDSGVDYLDMQFIDPSSTFHKPINALLRGETVEAIKEVVMPFFGTEIQTGRLMSLMSNEDQYGNPIYNVEDDPSSQFTDGMSFFGGTMLPGYAHSINKMYLGLEGYTSEYGVKYDFWTEFFNSTIGIKKKRKDLPRLYQSRIRTESERLSSAKKLYTDVKDNKNVSDEDKKKALDKANRRLKAITNDMQEIYDAGLDLGFSRSQMQSMTKRYEDKDGKEGGTLLSEWKANKLKKRETIQIDEKGDYIDSGRVKKGKSSGGSLGGGMDDGGSLGGGME